MTENFLKRRKGIAGRVAALLLSGIMLTAMPFTPVGTAAVSSAASEYWAQPYLQNMVDEGIMTGNSRGNLNPSDRITRAEFSAMINRAFGFSKTAPIAFSDVRDTDWFHDDIAKGFYEGYFQGTGGGKASPNDQITREAAVTMLGRALRLQTDPTLTNSFTDDKNVSNWARPFVNIASDKGFVSGYADGSFSPASSVSRAEVAKMISSLTGDIVKDRSPVRLDYVDGNVTLTASGGGLRNTTIAGDLYITDGVGTGSILLDNVTVLGQVIVSGAGEADSGACSVIFRDCEINELITDVPDGKKLSITTQGQTVIDQSFIKGTAYVDSSNTGAVSAFRKLTADMSEGSQLDLAGNFAQVILKGPANQLNLQKGFISSLTVDEDALGSSVFLAAGTDTGTLFTDTAANVTGKGTIGESVIATNGTVIEQLPDKITIRPGVTANINGQDMTQSQGDQINIIPEILSNYPKITEEDLKTAKATVKVNKSGKLYWLVIPRGYAPPTDAQMINPKLLGSVVISGSQNVTDNADIVIPLTKLTAGTDYVFYAMLTDQRDEHSAIKKAEFSTIDNTAPKFTYTKVEAQTTKADDGSYNYSINTVATVSKNATVYYMVLESGKTAPSATDLINQRMTCAAKGSRSFSKNISTSIDMPKLEESVKYDLYMIAVDDNSRQSAIFKTTVTMADTTAPSLKSFKYTPGTNNIKYTFVPDENCTKVYWAVYYTNSPTVQTIEKDTLFTDEGLLWYETDSARNAIIRAAGAVQSAQNLTAKALSQTNFTVSNLDSQRYYKLYMVLEDAAGNQSHVYTIEAATVDKSDPQVELSMGSTNGTELYIGTAKSPTSISLIFNEVVLGRNGDVQKDLSLFSKAELDTFIKLYRGDESATADVSRLMHINWDEASINVTAATDENPEHTVITFSVSNDQSTALQLNTGEKYTFLFTYNAASNIYISDKSGNTLKKIPTGSAAGGNYTAVTKTFGCVAPNVTMTAPAGGISSQITTSDGKEHKLDFTFRTTPTEANKASSAENKYDYYFVTDSNVTVNVFRQDPSGQWDMIAENRPLFGTSSIDSETGVSVRKLQGLTESQSPGWQADMVNFADQQFNKLGEATGGSEVIAIELTQFNGSRERDSWNGQLQGKLTCVIGEGSILARRANGLSSDGSTVVGSARDTLIFTDTVAPDTEYSILETHDTSIDVNVRTNKDITLYWVAVPNKTLNPEMLISSELVYQHILGESETGAGYVYNSKGVKVRQINSIYTVRVDGLVPDTTYNIYFIAENENGKAITVYDKGDVHCLSNGKPQFVNGKTKEVETPQFMEVSAGNYVNVVTNECSNKQMVFTVYTDIPSRIYWKVFTTENDKLVKPLINADQSEIKLPSAVASYVEKSQTSAVYSSASANSAGLYETKVVITGLKEATKYSFYALAESITQENVFCTIPAYAYYDNFQLPDLEYPKITSVDFNYTMGSYPIGKGRVTVTVRFDKPIYYVNGASVSPVKPTDLAFERIKEGDREQSTWWNFSPANDLFQYENTVTGKSEIGKEFREYYIEAGGTTTSNVNYVTLTYFYSGYLNNISYSDLSSKFDICNSSGSVAGQLNVHTDINGSSGTCTATLDNGTSVTSSRSKAATGSPYHA